MVGDSRYKGRKDTQSEFLCNVGLLRCAWEEGAAAWKGDFRADGI